MIHTGSTARWYAVLQLAPDRNCALFAATNALGLKGEGIRGTDQAAQVLVRRLDAAVPVRYRIRPDPPLAGQDVAITYLSSLGPLAGSKEMKIHCGFNNWQDGQDVPMTHSAEDAWEVTIDVPPHARQIDFVFTDSDKWDNNSAMDWHVRTRP